MGDPTNDPRSQASNGFCESTRSSTVEPWERLCSSVDW